MASCGKICGICINICSIIVGILCIIAGTSLWTSNVYVNLNLFMLSSGLLIIAMELMYFARLMTYLKFYQTLWGRTVFFTYLGILSFYNGDTLHITCMALIFCVVGCLAMYGLIASLLLKVSFGVPPPLFGYSNNVQKKQYAAGDP